MTLGCWAAAAAPTVGARLPLGDVVPASPLRSAPLSAGGPMAEGAVGARSMGSRGGARVEADEGRMGIGLCRLGLGLGLWARAWASAAKGLRRASATEAMAGGGSHAARAEAEEGAVQARGQAQWARARGQGAAGVWLRRQRVGLEILLAHAQRWNWGSTLVGRRAVSGRRLPQLWKRSACTGRSPGPRVFHAVCSRLADADAARSSAGGAAQGRARGSPGTSRDGDRGSWACRGRTRGACVRRPSQPQHLRSTGAAHARGRPSRIAAFWARVVPGRRPPDLLPLEGRCSTPRLRTQMQRSLQAVRRNAGPMAAQLKPAPSPALQRRCTGTQRGSWAHPRGIAGRHPTP